MRGGKRTEHCTACGTPLTEANRVKGSGRCEPCYRLITRANARRWYEQNRSKKAVWGANRKVKHFEQVLNSLVIKKEGAN